MGWTALLPFKPPAQRKSRLAGLLAPDARIALSQLLFDRVIRALEGSGKVGAIHLLAADRPAGWTGGWHADLGRGLNVEIEVACAAIGRSPLLVLHADLALLQPMDVDVLLDAAEQVGRAIAPDRHGQGTNAVALYDDRPFAFAFGTGSLAAHRSQGPAALVDRLGLTLDVDSPDDLAAAMAHGFRADGNSS